MFTLSFWRDAIERGISTAAQSALLAFGAEQIDLLAGSWTTVLGFALGGFVLSILKSLVAAGIGERGTASILP